MPRGTLIKVNQVNQKPIKVLSESLPLHHLSDTNTYRVETFSYFSNTACECLICFKFLQPSRYLSFPVCVHARM